ncbi:hypothetical protein Scep_025208 [Stephania cephalantha]|uniref:Pentatricopeptide repeat-containing protein n=1 Tax=Stephania cephalantha TaxID=152367 RepID=A0AAP0EI99_9MAGN
MPPLRHHHHLRRLSTTTTTTTTTTKPPNSSSSRTKKARTLIGIINNHHHPQWSPTLESSLAPFTTHLSETTFLQTLRLIRSPAKALHFFNWAHSNSPLAHSHRTFLALLQLLARTRNLNAARNLLFSIESKSNGLVKLHDQFFNTLIRSYGDAGLIHESIKLFSTMDEMGIAPSVFTFNSLLSVLLRRGRTQMAKKVFDEMPQRGVSPDVVTFNVLIRGCCLNSMIDDGFWYFREMDKFQVCPDVVTYNTLVDGLCRVGKVRTARNLVKGMMKSPKKGVDLSPNVVTWTTLLRGYCEKQWIDEALEVFEEIVKSGMKPNGITYNTLIQGLCAAKRFDKIREVMEGMIGEGEGGFAPDTCTFNTLMNAHCGEGRLGEAMEVFEKMNELRVPPDSASYSILIRRLCEDGEFGRAEEMVDELLKKGVLLCDDGCTPLVAAYNPIFEYLCSNGKTKKAERVFRQLFKRGTQDPPAFKVLILGHCKEGTPQPGFDLLVLMLRRDFVPDAETYDSLIQCFLQKNEPSFAYKTIEKMLKSSHHPRTSTFHTILTALIKEGCAAEAASLLITMVNKKIRQNINISTATVIALFKSRIKDTAFHIVGLIYDNGFCIRMEEVICFLCKNRRFVEAKELLIFSLEKHQMEDNDIYSTVITGLCKSKRAAEAFNLYYEMTEKGKQTKLNCLSDLKLALESASLSNEASFVSKRMARQIEVISN